MSKALGVSAAVGLLLGLAVIWIVNSNVPDGGETLTKGGMALIVVGCTALATVVGAVIKVFRGGSASEG